MADLLLRTEYTRVKQLCSADWKSMQAGDALLELVVVSLNFLLDQCQPIDLISKVPRKSYFTFQRGNIVARPVNKQLFLGDSFQIANLWGQWLNNTISPDNFAILSYTASYNDPRNLDSDLRWWQS